MSGGNSVYVSVWWLQVRNSLALFPELPLQQKKKREPGNIIYDVSNVVLLVTLGSRTTGEPHSLYHYQLLVIGRFVRPNTNLQLHC